MIFLPTPLFGNVIGPSFVDMICAPLPATFGAGFIGALIAIPSLLVIVTIETLVVNRLSDADMFWRLFRWLLLANAVSSCFGLFIDIRAPGSIYPAWWGFILAYLLSALVESPLIWWPLRQKRLAYHTALKYSFIANAASYAFLTVAALALTAIPMYQSDPTNLREELQGQIFVYHHRHALTRFDGFPSVRRTEIVTDDQPYTHGFCGSSSGRMFLVDGQFRAWELDRVGDQWRTASEPTSLPGRLLAVGADGETLVCGAANAIILCNKHGVIKTVATKEKGLPVRAALSHDSRYLAYTVMEPGVSSMQAISESGWPAEGTMATMPPQFLQDYGTLFLLDISTGTSSELVGTLNENCIGFHPSKNLLAIGGVHYPDTWIGTLSIINVETLSTKVIVTGGDQHAVSDLAWSPDGKFLAFLRSHGPHGFVARGFDASLWVVSDDGTRLAPLPVAIENSRHGAWNVAWRND